jgi:putative ABC transport system permease protein
MSLFHSLSRGVRVLWRRGAADRDLADEMLHFVDEATREHMAGGLAPDAARRAARLDAGTFSAVREEVRAAGWEHTIGTVLADLRYAVRRLRRDRGFTVVTVTTLALGIGATTVMFTLINSVLLKPYPYPKSERLVSLIEQTDFSTQYGNQWAFAYPNFVDCARETRAVTVAAWRVGGGVVSAPGDAEYVTRMQVSWNYFDLLGIRIDEGRGFLAEDDRQGAHPVALVTDAFWQRHAATRALAGAPVLFEGRSYDVIGVVTGADRFPGTPELFTLLGQDPAPNLQNRDAHPRIQVWGRLRDGASLAQAQTELAVIGRQLAAAYPKSNAGRTFVAQQLRPDVGDVGSTLWLLLAAVGLVLVIACANIASLLLARAVSRDRELAMRAALGAGRARLVRQCLTESAALGLVGGMAGVALAAFGVQPFVALWPGTLPRATEIQLDWRVLLFAVAVSLASGVLFGLAPALRARGTSLEHVLRAAGRTAGSASRRVHAAFVVCEVALAIVLLVCAGLLGRTLVRLSSLDPGMNVHNVIVARAALSPSAKSSPARMRAAWADTLDRIRRVPGVEQASLVDTVPMRQGNNQLGFWTTAALPPPTQRPLALATTVTPEYLGAAGMHLRYGRFFDERDRMGTRLVIVVDDVLAQTAFGTANAVGRSLWVPDIGEGPLEIVGVVGHVRHWGLGSDDDASVRAQLYYPFAQLPDRFVGRWSELFSIVVRTGVPPSSLIDALRRALREGSGDQVMYGVRTLEELAAATIARQRFLLVLFGIFAAVALLLACIGVYGVLAYLTSRRTAEIGVRVALGASARDVMLLVLGQSAGMIAGGIVAGAIIAMMAARVLQRLVDGVHGIEPATFVTMIALLAAAALTASWVPAWRAARIDPAITLRTE